MIKEKCSCGNMVAGVFTPSDTRRYLTSLAKKGGMKAVLAALGSVVPGLGNIGGLLVGSLIDPKIRNPKKDSFFIPSNGLMQV